jgi:hypothetical protein
MKTLCRTALLAALLLAAGVALPAAAQAPAEAQDPGPPEWFVNHLKTMTENSGRWIANNAAHRSDSEPFDAYGMAWTWGLGKKSATSRLFVVRGGQELGTLWEHRTVWHPGEKKALTLAFGSDGTYGTGVLEPAGDHEIKLEEVFFNVDGTSYREGHRIIDLGNGQVEMQSFGIKPDGTWEPRRSYVWKLDGVTMKPTEGAGESETSGLRKANEDEAADQGEPVPE